MAGLTQAEPTVRTFVILLILALSGSASAAPKRTVQIGVVLDGPWPGNEPIVDLYFKEILALTEGELTVKFPAEKRKVGDWTAESVRNALDTFLADKDVDVILAFGLIAANIAGQRSDLPKPVIAPYVVDAELQGIPFNPKTGTSGKRRFTYVTNPKVLEADLATFRDLVGLRKVAYFVTDGLNTALPGV